MSLNLLSKPSVGNAGDHVLNRTLARLTKVGFFFFLPERHIPKALSVYQESPLVPCPKGQLLQTGHLVVNSLYDLKEHSTADCHRICLPFFFFFLLLSAPRPPSQEVALVVDSQ